MSTKKTILVFTENRKEESNIVNYFRSSDCVIRVAKEMQDFRHFVKNSMLDFVLIDSSVSKYSVDISKILDSMKLKYFYLSEESSSEVFTDVIQKPYSFQSLVTLIENKANLKFNFDQKKIEEFLDSQNYVTVKIDDVINLKKVPYDYFVKINESKYVRIAKEGTEVATQILNNILGKGVQVVYANREQYYKYLEMLTKTSVNINNMKVDKAVKMKFLSRTSNLIMDQIFTEGVSKEMLFSSKQILDSSMNVAFEDDNVFNMLSLLDEIDQELYKHSLGVSIYSVLIAKHLKWETEGTIFKLSLGALFADIGLKGIDPSIVKRANSWLTEEEAEEYRRHPSIGADIMRSSFIGTDIIDIIQQHHENNDGTGFPRRLNKNTIHPLAKVVRVAHEFCEQALKSSHNPNPESPRAILRRLYLTGGKKFDLPAIEALAKAHGFKIEELLIAA